MLDEAIENAHAKAGAEFKKAADAIKKVTNMISMCFVLLIKLYFSETTKK
jgi:hypothetical protein